MKSRIISGLLASVILISAALAADNFPINTFGGTRTILKSRDDGSGAQQTSVDISSLNGSALSGGTLTTSSLGTASIIGAVSTAGVMAAASTNATSVAATPGNVYAAKLCNTTAFMLYFKFYDLTVAPTVGTSTPTVPPILISSRRCSPVMEGPLSFVNGIAYAITGGIANTDTTAVPANSVVGTLFYKAQ